MLERHIFVLAVAVLRDGDDQVEDWAACASHTGRMRMKNMILFLSFHFLGIPFPVTPVADGIFKSWPLLDWTGPHDDRIPGVQRVLMVSIFTESCNSHQFMRTDALFIDRRVKWSPAQGFGICCCCYYYHYNDDYDVLKWAQHSAICAHCPLKKNEKVRRKPSDSSGIVHHCYR